MTGKKPTSPYPRDGWKPVWKVRASANDYSYHSSIPSLWFCYCIVGCISWRCLCTVTMVGGVQIGQHRFLVYGGAGKLLRTSTVLSAFFFFFIEGQREL